MRRGAMRRRAISARAQPSADAGIYRPRVKREDPYPSATAVIAIQTRTGLSRMAWQSCVRAANAVRARQAYA